MFPASVRREGGSGGERVLGRRRALAPRRSRTEIYPIMAFCWRLLWVAVKREGAGGAFPFRPRAVPAALTLRESTGSAASHRKGRRRSAAILLDRQ
jgi:hypothetical protein